MQLIQINSTPLEYKLRITNAELRVADEAKKEAYETKENVFSLDFGVAQNKPNVAVSVDNSKTESEKQRFSDVDEEDIALKLASDNIETEDLPKVSEVSVEEQFQARIKEEFLTRFPVNDYVETRNSYGAVNETQSFENVSDNLAKQAKALSAYQQAKQYEFQPGEVKMEVLTKPSVEIVYVGGFMYVPPESNPDYEEPAYENVA
jgi:hypothetical protein